MSRHDQHAMHTHSLAAHRKEAFDLGKRELAIYGKLVHAGPLTDRELLTALFPGTDDMNRVRPRVTELIRDGWAVECGEKTDPHTGKTVRIVRALSDQEHAALVEREERNAGQLELLTA
jgi:hypothetical protein